MVFSYCLFPCYIAINCIREDTEQKAFCLPDTDRNSTQPSLGGDEQRELASESNGLHARRHTGLGKPQEKNYLCSSSLN